MDKDPASFVLAEQHVPTRQEGALLTLRALPPAILTLGEIAVHSADSAAGEAARRSLVLYVFGLELPVEVTLDDCGAFLDVLSPAARDALFCAMRRRGSMRSGAWSVAMH